MDRHEVTATRPTASSIQDGKMESMGKMNILHGKQDDQGLQRGCAWRSTL